MKLKQLLAMSPAELKVWREASYTSGPSRAEIEGAKQAQAFDELGELVERYPIRCGRTGHICVAD